MSSMPSLLRAFYILTYVSLVISTVIFILSMLDLGFASLRTNPVISLLTIIYHTVILVLQNRKRRSRLRADGSDVSDHIYPTSKIASLVFAYLLGFIWVFPIAFTTIGGINFANVNGYLHAGNARTMMAQFVFDIIEFGIMVAIASISTRMRVVSNRCAKSRANVIMLSDSRSMNKSSLKMAGSVLEVFYRTRLATSSRALLRAVYNLTYVSLAISTLIFILSMLDLGYASLFINPIFSGLTIIYHIVILILQRRDRRSRLGTDGSESIPSDDLIYPTSKTASLVLAYLLASGWIAPVVVTAMLSTYTDYVGSYPSWPPAGNARTVMAQVIFSGIECALMFAIAGISTRMRVISNRWAISMNKLSLNTAKLSPEAIHRITLATSSLLRAFYILTYVSLTISTLIFILSMLDLGYASLFTNPVVSPLNIIYHIVILVLHGRKRRSRLRADGSVVFDHIYPTSKIASLVFAYLLGFIWINPIAFTTISGGLWGFNYTYEDDILFAGNKGTAIAQLCFDVIEFGIMIAIAGISTRMRVVASRLAEREAVSVNKSALKSDAV